MGKRSLWLMALWVGFGLLGGWAPPAAGLMPPVRDVYGPVVNQTDTTTEVTFYANLASGKRLDGSWKMDGGLKDLYIAPTGWTPKDGLVYWEVNDLRTKKACMVFAICSAGQGLWYLHQSTWVDSIPKVTTAEGIGFWSEQDLASQKDTLHVLHFRVVDSLWDETTFVLASGEYPAGLVVKDSVVAAYIYTSGVARPTAVFAAAYHPLPRYWYSIKKPISYEQWQFDINCSTIEIRYTTTQPGVVFPDILGFDTDQRYWLDNHITSTYPCFDWQAGDAKDVYFWDMSLGTNPSSYGWDFGDGQKSTDRTPYHVYPALGKYHVILIVFGQYSPEGYSADVKTDYRGPEGSIKINQGAPYTNSTQVFLDLSGVTDNSGAVTWYRVRNEGGDWSAWCQYSKSPQLWFLTPCEGLKKVEAECQDASDNVSLFAAEIVLDTTAPQDGTLTATPGGGKLTLKWSGFNDATSGVGVYYLYHSQKDFPAADPANEIYRGRLPTFSHPMTGAGTHYYRVCAGDKAGNLSPGATGKFYYGGGTAYLKLLLEQ